MNFRPFLAFVPLLLLCACERSADTGLQREYTRTLDTASSCPFVSVDEKGNIVVCYIKDLTQSNSIVCLRTFDPASGTFTRYREVSPSTNVQPHGENAPKVAYKSNGECFVIWGVPNPNPGNRYSGLMYYAVSKDHGKTWSPARRVVEGEDNFDQRYFDLQSLPDGEIGLFWLDKRNATGGEASCAFFTRTKSGKSFEGETIVDRNVCPCCRTELFVDSRGMLHACYRSIIADTVRDMVHVLSHNGSAWSRPERISRDNWVVNGCPHTGPAMCENATGLHFAWYTGGKGGGVFYANSADGGRTFSAAQCVSAAASAKHPQMAAIEKNRLLITWDESVKYADAVNSRIGFELRAQNDIVLKRGYLSSDSLVSEYPVVAGISGGSALILYSGRVNGRKSVYCRFISDQEQ